MTSSTSLLIPLRPLSNQTRSSIYPLTWLPQSHPSSRYALSPIQSINSSFSSSPHRSDRHALFKPTSDTRYALLNLILQIVSFPQLCYCACLPSSDITYNLTITFIKKRGVRGSTLLQTFHTIDKKTWHQQIYFWQTFILCSHKFINI